MIEPLDGDSLSGPLARLVKKAKANRVEVEDLLKVVALDDPRVGPTLRQLKLDYDWPESGRKGRARVVPLGTWVNAICLLYERGVQAIADELLKPEGSEIDRKIAFDVLNQVRTAEAVAIIVQVGERRLLESQTPQDKFDEWSQLICSTLNEMLCFKPQVSVSEPLCERARLLLQQVIKRSQSANVLSSAYCATRAVGDLETIELIRSRPPLTGAWRGIEETAVKAIRSRLRRRTSEP